MSHETAHAVHDGPAPTGTTAAHLRAIDRPAAPAARPRALAAAIIVGGIGAVLGAQLLISIAVSEGAYSIEALRTEQTRLGREQQLVVERLDALSSPQNLSRSAEALGMVQSTAPAYLRLSDGAVLGVPSAAGGSGGSAPATIPNELLDDVPLIAPRG